MPLANRWPPEGGKTQTAFKKGKKKDDSARETFLNLEVELTQETERGRFARNVKPTPIRQTSPIECRRLGKVEKKLQEWDQAR